MSSSTIRTTRGSGTGLKLFLSVLCLGAMTGGFFVGRMAYRSIPEARKSDSKDSNQQSQKLAARINMVVGGKSYIILESECDEDSRRTVRSKLSSLAERLASHVNVEFSDAS